MNDPNKKVFKLNAVPPLGETPVAAPKSADPDVQPLFTAQPVEAAPGAFPDAEPVGTVLIPEVVADDVPKKEGVIAKQLHPLVQQAVDAWHKGVNKMKSDYWAGMLTGAVIVLTIHYIVSERNE